jgi:hypothetical protein
VTFESLSELADRGLNALMQTRRDAPTATIAILAAVLLTTGKVLLTTVNRDDRLALFKLLVRTHPVFGFLLVSDSFLHGVLENGAAVKTDAFLANFGTRERRLARVRTYRVVDGGVVFDDPIEMDPRAEGDDVYASVFAVPLAEGPPS